MFDQKELDDALVKLVCDKVTTEMYGEPRSITDDEFETFIKANPDKFWKIREECLAIHQKSVMKEVVASIDETLGGFSPDDNVGVFEAAGVCPELLGMEMKFGLDDECRGVHCYECWTNAVSKAKENL